MYTLKLYHHPLSVCSMKVRLALEEKGLDWTGRVIDILRSQEQLDPWYLALNSKGVIPTLEWQKDTTEVITDSAHIIRFIASLPNGKSLLPQSDTNYQLMDYLLELADTIDLQILSYARHPSMEKSEKILDKRIKKSLILAKQYPELKQIYLDCAARSERSKTFRVDVQHIKQVEQRAHASIIFAEQQLVGKSFLLGDEYSLADVIWTVVLSRLELLGYSGWVNSADFPLLANYYDRMKQRESYKQAQIQNQWWG
ncbi:glutathione S-transferase [Salinivibrio sp. IB574]|uniref:glutathione S-transferase family protein n=1 Tax=Salinivibrio sp. IB574 TaxID=1909444 RepID=UPI00098970B3|nr:glutathione S-transferase family protein [Salinivibrio sp. IB574]OOF21224.1 glutathione S-transferase [Salinivibrio sp. IB574]